MKYKVSEYAKLKNVTYRTVWNWVKSNKINFQTTNTGGLVIVEEDSNSNKEVAVYARVSSSENKDNLERQKNRLLDYCASRGYKVSSIVTAVIDPAHRGQDLYAKMLKHFVGKTPHVLYSDIAQSKGSAKSWSGIAKSSDSEGIDFRVHPLLHQSDNIVGTGISKSGELDPRYWIGTPLPSGGYLPAEKMRFSIRRK